MKNSVSAEALRLNTLFDGQEIPLYPVLIEVEGKYFLTDCGYEESYDELVRLLRQKNLDVSQLAGILISHDDIDHIGSLYKLRQSNPELLVYASRIEEPSLSGKMKSERLVQAERLLEHIPEEHKGWALDFQNRLKATQRVSVDKILEDGDRIAHEIRVIHTPGHTRGHLSFYVERLKLLIASDAVVIENNELNIANPEFTLDLKAAIRSVRLLATLDIEKMICYHGGIFQGNIKDHLNRLLRRYEQTT
jgi:glyoxylase-like metal-dependent hydrolase (beta-lactamase superfamily II)